MPESRYHVDSSHSSARAAAIKDAEIMHIGIDKEAAVDLAIIIEEYTINGAYLMHQGEATPICSG